MLTLCMVTSVLAAIFFLVKKSNHPWIVSLIMSIAFIGIGYYYLNTFPVDDFILFLVGAIGVAVIAGQTCWYEKFGAYVFWGVLLVYAAGCAFQAYNHQPYSCVIFWFSFITGCVIFTILDSETRWRKKGA